MNEHISSFLQKKWTIPGLTAGGGFIIGAIAGYLATKAQYDRIEKSLEKLNEDQITLTFDQEKFKKTVEESRFVINELNKRSAALLSQTHPEGVTVSVIETNTSPHDYTHETVIGEITSVSQEEDGRLNIEGRTNDAVVVSIFDNAGDEWDYKTEVENRDTSRPYVIHVDEYVTDEKNWDSQSTLTWYEKDQILCDSHDAPIYNWQDMIGPDLLFGHGSNDPNVFYVRNEQLKAEFEILRDRGSFVEIVLGESMERQAAQDEIKHSTVPKFRRE